MTWKAMDRYSTDLAALKEAGVEVHRTPDTLLDAQLAAWDKVIGSLSADPFFAKVIESQKAWVKRVVGLEFDMEVDQKKAYDHFFA
jgi:TRAP-type mannitol/chloroaromatic compound transport system substrate-binding protein